VADAYGILQAALDPESLGFFGGDAVIGVEPEKIPSLLKDTKLSEGRFLTFGDGYRTVLEAA